MKRRDFLLRTPAEVAGVVTAFHFLVQNLLSGMFRTAIAEATPIDPMNLLLLHQSGGLARWYFDLFLKPRSEMAFDLSKNLGMVTRFNAPPTGGSQYESAKYEFYEHTQTDGSKIFCPYLWGQSIYRPTGGTAPMTVLLENMFSLRGFLMPSDGHINNDPRTTRPDGSLFSLDGAVADAVYQSKILPVVALSAMSTRAFRTQTGMGAPLTDWTVNLPEGQPMINLLNPFYEDPESRARLLSETFSKREVLDAAVESALSAMAQFSRDARGIEADVLFGLRHTADAKIREGFSDLVESYTPTYLKYKELCDRAIQTRIIGIDDLPVKRTSSNSTFGAVYPANSILHEDLTLLLHEQSELIQLRGMAETFAMAEILICQGLSSGISHHFESGYITGVNIGSGLTGTLTADEHLTAWAVSLIANKAHFLGFSSCLYEFISVLKASGLWERSLIYSASELGRKGRTNGTGTDHNISNHATCWSGIIKGPIVLGNILTSGEEEYPGTIGLGANVSHGGSNAPLTVKHMVNTVAAMIGVDLPAGSNFPSVVAKDPSGSVTADTALIEEAQNVSS